MKRYNILILLSCLVFLCHAQTIDELFKTMPDELLPAFSEANKTMLLVDSSLSVIPYPLGEIERIDYNDSFLYLRKSEVGTLQLKLLTLVNNTTIVAVVNTVCSGICDSNIRFYTDEWQEIEKEKILPALSPTVFFDKEKIQSPSFKWATSHIDIYPLQFKFKKGSDNLEVQFDIANHLSREDLEKIEPYLSHQTISLMWNKSSFVL